MDVLNNRALIKRSLSKDSVCRAENRASLRRPLAMVETHFFFMELMTNVFSSDFFLTFIFQSKNIYFSYL